MEVFLPLPLTSNCVSEISIHLLNLYFLLAAYSLLCTGMLVLNVSMSSQISLKRRALDPLRLYDSSLSTHRT